ncbi:MAG TPA: DUF1707 domain-containing protein [Propionibacterium sp.]|jgi:hypothetical protein|nr:DUF1707 domain-containing protein [Propionibacterium sp.]
MTSPEPTDVGPKFGGDLRVGDSDRDRVMTVLSTAYAEGRLTKDEHDERLAAAADARTFDDLVPLTRDLVPLHAPIRTNVPAHQPPGTHVPRIDGHSTGESETLVAVFGGSTRRGVWRARRQIRSFALFGGSELDFSEAIFEHDVIEITGFWLFGGLDVKIPEGVEVHDEVVGIFGGSDVKNTRPTPGGPKIILKGIALFGGVSVKGPKKKRT